LTFFQVSHKPFSQERVAITEDNFPSWHQNINIVNNGADQSGGSATGGINDHLQLSPGDTVWLSRRRALAEVSDYPDSPNR
jgi:hypothetical protein